MAEYNRDDYKRLGERLHGDLPTLDHRRAVRDVTERHREVGDPVVVFHPGAPAAELGLIYLGTAIIAGALFIWKAFELWRRPDRVPPMGLYKYSLLYLAIVFVAMGLDAAIL